MSDKQGIVKIIDLLEALRVRLLQTREHHMTPPTTVGDERLVANLDHWVHLCVDAKLVAIEMRAPIEHMTAFLALPADAPMTEIAEAVVIMLKRLQKLETERAALSETHVAGSARVTFETPIAPGESRTIMTTENGPPLRGLAPGIKKMAEALEAYDDGPQCEAKGQCTDNGDGSRACAGCGRWLGDEPEPPPSEETLRPFREAVIRAESNEPRPSWVLDRLEALVLGGWLGDAVKNIERVAEYMRANEERMSEDLFDELGRIATKIDGWAEEVMRGNMFPKNGGL